MTASPEREVKLAASAAFSMPPLEGLGEDVLTISHDAERLHTVYFDTSDFRLARWGVSLRHREGQGWTTKLPPEKALNLEIAALYWHFVDVVWIVIFPVVYLMR
jgi:hypothetical protein